MIGSLRICQSDILMQSQAQSDLWSLSFAWIFNSLIERFTFACVCVLPKEENILRLVHGNTWSKPDKCVGYFNPLKRDTSSSSTNHE